MIPIFDSSEFSFSAKNCWKATFSYFFNFCKSFPRIPFQYQFTFPCMDLSILYKEINLFIPWRPFAKVVLEMTGVACSAPFIMACIDFITFLTSTVFFIRLVFYIIRVDFNENVINKILTGILFINVMWLYLIK